MKNNVWKPLKTALTLSTISKSADYTSRYFTENVQSMNRCYNTKERWLNQDKYEVSETELKDLKATTLWLFKSIVVLFMV